MLPSSRFVCQSNQLKKNKNYQLARKNWESKYHSRSLSKLNNNMLRIMFYVISKSKAIRYIKLSTFEVALTLNSVFSMGNILVIVRLRNCPENVVCILIIIASLQQALQVRRRLHETWADVKPDEMNVRHHIDVRNHISFDLFPCLPLLFFYSDLLSMRCSEAGRATET